MANRHTDFWLALLEFGNSAEERKQHWNEYLVKRMPSSLNSAFFAVFQNMGEEDLLKRMFLTPTTTEESRFDPIADAHGGHPELPPDLNFVGHAIMDFSDHQFDQDVSFGGRVLLFASFDNASFGKNADFRNTVFGGPASFNNATFQSTDSSIGNGNRFEVAIFGNTASFKAASFACTANFSKARFRTGAYFDDAEFRLPPGGALFTQSEFSAEASFNRAKFSVGASFDRAQFRDRASFREAVFDERIVFNNAKFEAETSFRHALFRTPPRFFEAIQHEDTDFGGVDWKPAEAAYSRPWWKDLLACRPWARRKRSVESANDAVRAWDRLALIMNRFEKPHERHTFYRLRMRAQRQPGKTDLLSMMNRLFDITCDYGWGLGRALAWWAGHIVLFGVILAACAARGSSSPEPGCGPAWGESVLVSFANAHAILGLASQHGYLNGVRDCLTPAVQPDWIMPTVGTIQAIIGPILLFLLLLTARNRFRLG